MCSSDQEFMKELDELKEAYFLMANEIRIVINKYFSGPVSEKKVIDSGCGTGGLVKELWRFGLWARGVEIGRGSCRESGWKYVWFSVVAVELKKEIKKSDN